MPIISHFEYNIRNFMLLFIFLSENHSRYKLTLWLFHAIINNAKKMNRSDIMQYRLTNKELDIMRVLWSSDTELSITDFIRLNPSLNTSTVQASLRSLLKKSYVRVAGIEQHNKVLARTYLANLTEFDYLLEQIQESSQGTLAFFAEFIKRETSDTICELEKMIQERKASLSQ